MEFSSSIIFSDSVPLLPMVLKLKKGQRWWLNHTGRSYEQLLPERMLKVLAPAPFLTTAAFGVVCLVLASWLFTRKEF